MPNLLWFEWGRDRDGYNVEEQERWRATHDTADFLIPIGRATLRYHPLEEFPALFREFACNKHTPQDAIDFTHKYGFVFDHGNRMAIEHWCEESAGMAHAIAVWEEGLKKNDLSEVIKSLQYALHSTIQITFRKAWGTKHPALYIKPRDLASALWLQFSLAVTEQTEFRKCLHCPAWFTFGPGTGRRKTAFYCSARCRRAAHRSKEKRK